ncbi:MULTISPECIES: hypothetical protein [Bacillus]|uniref:hypothetical protein n=1 Tax=Bacillus TaxID=1386 RepID=UPI0004104636|nr:MULTISPECIES: hypothetical protein [Bacillus]QHZ47206.1 hypothetical protein M654_013325 [Bacillus sp. NSP9.1]
MLVVLGIPLIAGLIILLELPTLWKKKQKKEIWVFSLLLALAVALCITEGLGVELPNPLDWLAVIYKPLGDAIMTLLQ